MNKHFIPGTVILDDAMLHRLATMLEEKAHLLEIHIREIANNERYQHHKGMLKARSREVSSLREVLNLIDDELALAIGEKECSK